jgi:hypothetical protein
LGVSVHRAPGKLLDMLSKVNPARLEKLYRDRELYRGLRVEPPIALRLDGVGWGRRLKGFRKPRDLRVHEALLEAGRQLLQELNGCCAYIASDEINIILPHNLPYAGRVEKLVSISAGMASAAVARHLGMILFFDSRIVKLYSTRDTIQYILYRARVAFNNYVSTLYHLHNLGDRRYTPSLEEVINRLGEAGVDLGEPWTYGGSCIAFYKAERIVDGVAAERRRLVIVDAGVEACIRKVRESGREGSSLSPD